MKWCSSVFVHVNCTPAQTLALKTKPNPAEVVGDVQGYQKGRDTPRFSLTPVLLLPQSVNSSLLLAVMSELSHPLLPVCYLLFMLPTPPSPLSICKSNEKLVKRRINFVSVTQNRPGLSVWPLLHTPGIFLGQKKDDFHRRTLALTPKPLTPCKQVWLLYLVLRVMLNAYAREESKNTYRLPERRNRWSGGHR